MHTKLNLISAFVVAFITLTANIGQTLAGTSIGFYHNDAHPGKCVINDNLILSPGEKVKAPGQCAEISCLNEEGTASKTGCGSVPPFSGCKWGDYVDINAPYEKCCARKLICNGSLTRAQREYRDQVWNMHSR